MTAQVLEQNQEPEEVTPAEAEDGSAPEGDASEATAETNSGVAAETSETLDTETLLAAGRAGLTAQEIEEIGSSKALKAVIARLTKAETTDAEALKPFEIELPDTYDEELRSAFKKMVDFYEDREKKLRAELDPVLSSVTEIKKARDAEHVSTVMKQFDTAVGAAQEFSELFGTKVPEKGSKEFANRAKLWDAFKRELDATNGDVSQAVDFAVHRAFPKDYANLVKRRFVKTVARREAARISKPNQDKADGSSREEKAVAKVEALMRERKLGIYAE